MGGIMKSLIRIAAFSFASIASVQALANQPVLVPVTTTTMPQPQPPAPAYAPVEQPTFAAPPAPIASSTSENAVLRAGTPVSLRLLEEITTKKKAAKVGQRFQLEVAVAVEIDGIVVIPAGTPAWGELTSVRNKGMWGKSGKLEARLLYMRVNGRQIRLTGNFDDKGVTGTAGVVGAVALIPVAGFFMTGTSAIFPLGGGVGGFVDEDVVLAFKQTGPAPLEVPVSLSVPVAAEVPPPVPTTAID